MEMAWIVIPVGGVMGIGGLYLRDYLRKISTTTPLAPPFKNLPSIAMLGLFNAACFPLLIGTQGHSRHCARRTASANNLSQIGKALIIYAESSNAGMFPPTEGPAALIRRLHPGIAAEPRIFLSPLEGADVPDVPIICSDGTVSPQWCDAVGYVYVYPGVTPAPDAILMFERHAVGGGRNVLRVGGSVEWMDEADFRKELRQTPSAATAQP